jgi:type II secretion system (T2SS) protein G
MPQWIARPSRPPRRFAMERTFPASLFALIAGLLLATACGRAGEQAARDVLHAIDQGKLIGTRGTMENIGKALTTYAMDHGGYPQGSSIQEATAALVPAFLPSASTVDAWGNTLGYRSDTRSFTLTSPGADGQTGDADDLVMTDGRFTQLPAPPAQ